MAPIAGQDSKTTAARLPLHPWTMLSRGPSRPRHRTHDSSSMVITVTLFPTSHTCSSCNGWHPLIGEVVPDDGDRDRTPASTVKTTTATRFSPLEVALRDHHAGTDGHPRFFGLRRPAGSRARCLAGGDLVDGLHPGREVRLLAGRAAVCAIAGRRSRSRSTQRRASSKSPLSTGPIRTPRSVGLAMRTNTTAPDRRCRPPTPPGSRCWRHPPWRQQHQDGGDDRDRADRDADSQRQQLTDHLAHGSPSVGLSDRLSMASPAASSAHPVPVTTDFSQDVTRWRHDAPGDSARETWRLGARNLATRRSQNSGAVTRAQRMKMSRATSTIDHSG